MGDLQCTVNLGELKLAERPRWVRQRQPPPGSTRNGTPPRSPASPNPLATSGRWCSPGPLGCRCAPGSSPTGGADSGPGLDLPQLTFHQLRHRHACLLLDQGVPIRTRWRGARSALGEAVRDDLLDDNVAARVRLPRLDLEPDPEPQVLRTWDAAQAARFLELTADESLHPI